MSDFGILNTPLTRRTALLATLFSGGNGVLAQGVTQGTGVRATFWAQQWLKLVVKYQQNPLRAARALAYMQVAMKDAWMAGLGNDQQGGWFAELCSHRAASLVVAHLYPNETPGTYEAHYAWLQSQAALDMDGASRAHAVGTAVAQASIDRSLRDGAGRAWPIRLRPANFSGIWQATYPLYGVNPVEANAGNWQPWVQPASTRYVPPIAPRPGSTQHRDETLEVLAVSRSLTDKQKEIAQAWNLESGSVTPPGVWVQQTIAQLLAPTESGTAPSFERCVTVLAALSVAMMDALIACWAIKFRDWSERPITAIRRDLDSNFVPLLVTPSFPAYVSGHATVSGAAQTVLTAFWPNRATLFEAMAQEAAMSRLWGGIHFRGDNDEGLRLGRAVGNEVVAAKQSA